MLPVFLDRFNKRFAIPAASAENLHRKLNVPSSRLNDILCHRETTLRRCTQLTFHYGRRQIILDRSELSEGLAGKYVEVYTISQIGRSKCDGKIIRFPTACSIRSSTSEPVGYR